MTAPDLMPCPWCVSRITAHAGVTLLEVLRSLAAEVQP